MEPIIPEDFLDSLLSQISSNVKQYQNFLPSYQIYQDQRRQWFVKLETLGNRINDLYDPAMTDAFVDYATPIEDYCFVQGLLSAAGCLSKQAVKLVDLKTIPGLEAGTHKLKEACDYFLDQLPEEDRADCASFFEERKRHINRSGDYFFLHGFELMFSLLNKAGYDLPADLLEKLYEMVQPKA